MAGCLQQLADTAQLLQVGLTAAPGPELVHQVAQQHRPDPAGGAEAAALVDEEVGEILHHVEQIALAVKYHEGPGGPDVLEGDAPAELGGRDGPTGRARDLDGLRVGGTTGIQHRLFDIGGELSIPGHSMLDEERVTRLETTLDELNGELPALKEFILPGGTQAAALSHLARAICRRAERRVCSLGAATAINPVSARYLNRLSDLLFVMARHLNRAAGVADVLWEKQRN